MRRPLKFAVISEGLPGLDERVIRCGVGTRLWSGPAVLREHLKTGLVRQHLVTNVQVGVKVDVDWVVFRSVGLQV